MTSLLDVFAELKVDTTTLEPELKKKLSGINLDGEGDKAGKSFTNGMKGALAKGAALLGGTVLGVGLISGFNDALGQMDAGAKLQAQLGLTGKQSRKLGKVAGDLYAGAYGDSLDEVNQAVRSVVQDTNTSIRSVHLEGITSQVIDLSKTFDQDLGGVTRAVGQLMRTGLAKNAQQALNIITRGFQEGANKSDDFLDTLNEYGTQFRKLGLDGKTATGILTQGLKAGARDADVVADAVKEFSIRAVDGSKTTRQGFQQLGLDATDMANRFAKGGDTAAAAFDKTLEKLRGIKDPVKQNQVAVKLFGTQAEDLGKALFAIDPSKASKKIGDFGGAAGRMDKVLGRTASQTLTKFKRGLETDVRGGLAAAITAFQTGKVKGDGFVGFMSEAGAKAKTVFGFFKSDVLPILKSTADFFSQNKTAVYGLVGAIVAMTAVTKIGAAVMAVEAAGGLKAYLTGTKLVTGATKVWAAVQWVLDAALEANPIGLIVLGIAALVAGIVIAYKKSETFRNIVNGAFNAVKKVATAAMDKVVGAAKFTFNWLKKNWPYLLAIITGPFGLAVAVVVKNWDKIRAGAGVAKNFIVDKFNDLIGFFKGLPHRIGSATVGMFNGIRDAFRSAINWIIEKWNSLEFSIPGFDWPGPGSFPGITVGTPNIPTFARGGTSGGGMAIVGERGPELVKLARGDRVFSNSRSNDEARGVGEWLGKQVATGFASTSDRVSKAAADIGKKAIAALQKKLDAAQSLFGQLRDRFLSISGGVADAFRPDLLSAESLSDFFSQGVGAISQMKGLDAARKKLGKMGISSGFISQLFQSGNANLITQLAGSDKATARDAQALFGQTNQWAKYLGDSVAWNTRSGNEKLGVRVNAVRDEIRELRQDLRQAQRQQHQQAAGARHDGTGTGSGRPTIHVHDKSGSPRKTAHETARHLAFAGGG